MFVSEPVRRQEARARSHRSDVLTKPAPSGTRISPTYAAPSNSNRSAMTLTPRNATQGRRLLAAAQRLARTGTGLRRFAAFTTRSTATDAHLLGTVPKTALGAELMRWGSASARALCGAGGSPVRVRQARDRRLARWFVHTGRSGRHRDGPGRRPTSIGSALDAARRSPSHHGRAHCDDRCPPRPVAADQQGRLHEKQNTEIGSGPGCGILASPDPSLPPAPRDRPISQEEIDDALSTPTIDLLDLVPDIQNESTCSSGLPAISGRSITSPGADHYHSCAPLASWRGCSGRAQLEYSSSHVSRHRSLLDLTPYGSRTSRATFRRVGTVARRRVWSIPQTRADGQRDRRHPAQAGVTEPPATWERRLAA